MRPRTPARAALDRKAAPIRAALRDETDRCDRCGKRCVPEVHEILRGSYRARSQSERCNLLCLCRDCHQGKGSDTGMGGKSWEYQLAILYLNRQADFDLARFHAIAGRCKPDQSEVDEQVQVLLLQGR